MRIENGFLMSKRQTGMATLVVTVILLIAVSSIVIFTGRVVLQETRVEANNYRAEQAFSQANQLLDERIFELNQSTLEEADYISDAERCGSNPALNSGLLLASGTSDDGVAKRTIGQCFGPVQILAGDGPEIPLISRTQIDTTGNANIINRYTNTNIWSADIVEITGASMATYIRDPSSGPLTQEQLLNTDEDVNTQLVSNRNLGNGADIISEDPALDMDAGFFGNFFNADNREVLKSLAEGAEQYYSEGEMNTAAGEGLSGLVYLEGDQSLSGGQIGSIDSPAIVIVDGDLRTSGNPTVYGLVYVVGRFDVSGTPSIVGSSIVENEDGTGSGFDGSGTLNLVYWQNFLNDTDGPPVAGLSSVIEGSWRDW